MNDHIDFAIGKLAHGRLAQVDSQMASNLQGQCHVSIARKNLDATAVLLGLASGFFELRFGRRHAMFGRIGSHVDGQFGKAWVRGSLAGGLNFCGDVVIVSVLDQLVQCHIGWFSWGTLLLTKGQQRSSRDTGHSGRHERP